MRRALVLAVALVGCGEDAPAFQLDLTIANPDPAYVVRTDQGEVTQPVTGFVRVSVTYSSYDIALADDGVTLSVARDGVQISHLVARARSCSEACADGVCPDVGDFVRSEQSYTVTDAGVIQATPLSCFACWGTEASVEACP